MTVRIRVIPCLDVSNGRVVKGVNFVDLRDAGDPVEQAQAYDAAGADELCFLDIGASHEGRGTILDVVRRTAEVCLHAADRGRRGAQCRGCARVVTGRGGQGCGEQRGSGAARGCGGHRRAFWRPVCGCLGRCQALER